MNTKTVCAILLVCALSVSCGRVSIKNSEWCGDLGPFGADCFNTRNDNERELSKEEWDAERFGMVCTKAENFADWKAAILKLCLVTRRCSYDDKNDTIKFDRKVNAFKQTTKNVKHNMVVGNE